MGGDLKKIANDMLWTVKQRQTLDHLSVVDLGTMTRHRDVVKSGNVSLQDLVKVTLNEHLDKQLQLSTSTSWSAPILTADQQRYAALDAIKSLEVYFHLLSLKDLTLRLESNMLDNDCHVDIVPSTGCVTVLATRAGMGTVTCAGKQWSPPPGCQVRGRGCDRNSNIMYAGSDKYCVTVTKVLAPNLIVPGVVKDKIQMTLGDFGQVPFDIMLPICMLKEHVDSADVRSYPSSLTDPPRIPAEAATPSPPAQVCGDYIVHTLTLFLSDWV